MHSLTRKERDKQLREADIIKAAAHIFAIKGYHEATMSDIAKESQYAIGTIYLYFKDKQTLYLTLIEKKVQSLIFAVKEKIRQVKDIRGKIKILIKEQLSFFEKNEDFFRIYFSERGILWTIKDKISRSAVNRFIIYLDYVTELIKEAQKKGIIRKELNPKRTAYLLAGMMNATIFPWLRDRSSRKERLRDLSKFVLDVFYEGVGAK